MIRICYIIGQLGKGGAERQLYELVKGLNKSKFHPIVVSLSQGGYWSGELRTSNIEVVELRRKKHKDLKRLATLIKLVMSIKPDIVHTYMFDANFYGRIAAIIARVGIIVAAERNLPEIGKEKSLLQLLIDKLFARFSHGILCNSHRASHTLVQKYSFDAQKVFTVHNGIDVVSFLKEAGSNREEKSNWKVVGTIGRLYPQKNHKLFLDVAKLILEKSERAGIKFVIIGQGSLRDELIRYSNHLGIEPKVTFMGRRHDIPNLLKGMDVFVSTSSYEGLSNTIMEAMLAGLPVVATDVGGNCELVIDGATGFLCPSTSAQALAEKVIFLLKNDDLAARMGENGKREIISNFGTEKMVRQTERIYIKLLKQENIVCSFRESQSRFATHEECFPRF